MSKSLSPEPPAGPKHPEEPSNTYSVFPSSAGPLRQVPAPARRGGGHNLHRVKVKRERFPGASEEPEGRHHVATAVRNSSDYKGPSLIKLLKSEA